MELVALECLVALAEGGTFHKASRSIHRSPSSVTRSIQELERSLGVTLVIRSRGGLRLTPVGQRVAINAQAILAEHRRAPESALRRHETFTDPLRVGVSYSSPPAFQQLVASALRESLGGQRTAALLPDTSSRVLERVRRGDLDVGVVHAPTDTTGLSVWPLHEYSWDVALVFDDALAGRGHVTLEDLDPRRILAPPFHSGPAALAHVNRRVAEAGRPALALPSRDPVGAVHLMLRSRGQMPVISTRYGGWSLPFDTPWVTLVPLRGPGPEVSLVLVADAAERLGHVRDAASALQRAFKEQWSS